jgi:hypothetical protein
MCCSFELRHVRQLRSGTLLYYRGQGSPEHLHLFAHLESARLKKKQITALKVLEADPAA